MHIRRLKAGFTLIELMVVVAIVAILASIAVPSYLSQVRKGRRADAIATLQDLQLKQERWRTDHSTFAGSGSFTSSTALGALPTSPYYTYTVLGADATTYSFRAAPIGDQANDCGGANLELARAANATTTKTPAACWR